MKLKRPIEIEEGEIMKRHVCPFCEKEFSNGKALGGHKRIHLYKIRGRNNRKLCFSSNLNSESVSASSSTVSDVEQVPSCKVPGEDLKDVLPRWGSVGKRGKKGYGHIIRKSSYTEKMELPPSQFMWPRSDSFGPNNKHNKLHKNIVSQHKLHVEKGDRRAHSFDLNELPPEAIENGLD